jgi:DNA helicase-2/ATP-dependent DNA helicase PcrA
VAFYADLHVHSKHSRATSKECDLEHLAVWGAKKGLSVVGTGDFTHPAWRQELRDKLIPAGPGLYLLRPELAREVAARLPASCRRPMCFQLTVEISTIYKKGGRTRKVHHVVCVPDLDAAERLAARLARIGNLTADGRPILGLDSRDLLEIVLESSDTSYLIPAHVWTPWFSALGSRSGFASIDECYADLAHHIFAIETGLSSDPPMNWRVSSLDRFRLLSNSDAHSPNRLGREACRFATAINYYDMLQAMVTGNGFAGTIEFFPEEGKYHLDGHRSCGVRLAPEETVAGDGRCPVCGKEVTVGVLHRVAALADRAEGERRQRTEPFRSLVSLPEIVAEIEGVASGSKRVAHAYEGLLARLGPELHVLEAAPVEEIRTAGSDLLAEAITRLRAGRVARTAGYDGAYGRIRLFTDDELAHGTQVGVLFPEAAPPLRRTSPPLPKGEKPPTPSPQAALSLAGEEPPAAGPGKTAKRRSPASPLADLDREQAAAATIVHGPLLIIAGPGTGKTRTLTHRFAHLVRDHGVVPEQCLALTFTRRAAAEMEERLARLLPDAAVRITVTTFHGLGLQILRAHGACLGLPDGFRVAGEEERRDLLADALSLSPRLAARRLAALSRGKRSGDPPAPESELGAALSAYAAAMHERGWVDCDDLVARAVELLAGHADLAAQYRDRYRWLAVDEYQDIDAQQYRLVRRLAPPDGNLCAIGDPDQAIYGFRGADVGFFLRFQEDFPGARVVHLTRNYRSTSTIVAAARQVIAPASLVVERALEAVIDDPTRVTLHAAPTDRAEAEYVVASLERLLGGHSFFSVDSGRARGAGEGGYGFADFAILYRVEEQADLLVEALDRAGIPCRRRTPRPLADLPEVATLLDAIAPEGSDAPLETRLRAAARTLATPAAEHALTLLLPTARRCGVDLDRLTGELALITELDGPPADRVSLLTLHAAKGLEFPVVFIVGCEDRLLPLRWGAGTSDLAEERRLFFVGLTRARQRLILTRAKMRERHGRLRPMEASPFLHAIEQRLIDHAAPRPACAPDPQLELAL